VRKYIPSRYEVLGTDGFGRSDSRAALRDFFEVDANYVTIAALKALVDGVNSLKLVTDQILDFTPQSSASICAAFSTSLRMVPEPNNCTCVSPVPTFFNEPRAS
jgi:glycosidase